MQNNSNDNIAGWKHRLNQFEEAVEPAQQEMLWEQFQQKQLLAPAPLTKRKFYWMAAAAVISLLFCSIYYWNNASVSDPELPASVNSITSPATMTDHVVEITTEPIETPKIKSTVIYPKTVNLKKEFVLNNDSLMIIPIKAPVIVLNILPVAVDSALPSSQVLTHTNPKKLKLLHLNELNIPGSSADLAAQEGKPYFPINTPTRKVYGKSKAEPSTNDKDNLIRIKLFP